MTLQDPASDQLRLAIVATPRTGNTWLRYLLSGLYDLPHEARHQFTPEALSQLPPRSLIMVHARRDAAFQELIAMQGFRVVTIARHPLDVLISILHVVIYDVESEQWLGGRGGNESGIWGAMPGSRTFVDYACSPRATELLSVTCDWWSQPDTLRVRYEDLVHDTVGTLERLTHQIGPIQARSIAEIVERNRLAELAKQTINNHFWKGKPGLWRELITAADAEKIAAAHKPIFDKLGYRCDPDQELDALTADQNWIKLVGHELGQTIRQNTLGHHETLKNEKQNAENWQREAEKSRAERDALQMELQQIGKRLADMGLVSPLEPEGETPTAKRSLLSRLFG